MAAIPPRASGMVGARRVSSTYSPRVGLQGTGGDVSVMLEAIVLLLSVATCALILLAFWGLDLLRIRKRR
jgi:hypothetical protein